MKTINSFQDLFTDSHTLLNFTTNFFRHIDKSIKIDLNKEFEYNILYNTIFIGLEKFLAPGHIENVTHKKLLKEMGYDYESYCDYQTFCLIHEMGHKIMSNLYGENFWKMIDNYNKQVNKNRQSYEYSFMTYEELQRKYMKLDLEKDANDWAMLFILENPDIVKQFDKLFIKKVKTMLENRA